MLSKESELLDQIAKYSSIKQTLELKLYESTGVIESILNFFSGNNSESLRAELKTTDRLLEDVFHHYMKINKLILSIYDLWTTYPPDWNERVTEIKEKYFGCCSQCGSCRNLHVHHRISLARGGSNRLDNLVLLCEMCHKKIHNTDTFSGNGFNPAFGERVKKINYAIAANRNIEFLYKKPTDSKYAKRTVTPRELKQIQHLKTSGTTLCVEGFCHTRKESRTFALKRMKNLIIL